MVAVLKNMSMGNKISVSIAVAMYCSFFIMCVYWIVTGERYSLFHCLKLFIYICVPMAAILVAGVIVYSVRRYAKLAEISRIRESYGYCDEYFKAIENYAKADRLSENNTKLLKISALADSGRLCEAEALLDSLDFYKLNEEEKNGYINSRLFCAVASKDVERAEKIYAQYKVYYQRAYYNSNAHCIHTVGEYYRLIGNLSRAEKIFCQVEGFGCDDDALLFECEISRGWCCLETGRKEYAKAAAIKASHYANGILQLEKLRELMFSVELAYKSAG